jgi:hypothetical protein
VAELVWWLTSIDHNKADGTASEGALSAAAVYLNGVSSD